MGLKIAVTGGFGSGKSTVCRFIKEKGYPVFGADETAKEIMSSDEPVKSKIIKKFGPGAYKEGKINSGYMAGEVFNDPVKLKQLNSIVHPPTIALIEARMKEELKSAGLVFVEAALIYEARMAGMFDYVIAVISDTEKKVARMREKFGISEEEVLKRIENQIPDEKKAAQADFVIENNSSLADLESRAHLILKILENIKL